MTQLPRPARSSFRAETARALAAAEAADVEMEALLDAEREAANVVAAAEAQKRLDTVKSQRALAAEEAAHLAAAEAENQAVLRAAGIIAASEGKRRGIVAAFFAKVIPNVREYNAERGAAMGIPPENLPK